MIKVSTTINNKLGLHARASAKLTKLAGGYACEIWIARGAVSYTHLTLPTIYSV